MNIAILDTTGEAEEQLFTFPAQAARFDALGLLVTPTNQRALVATLDVLRIDYNTEDERVMIDLGHLTAEVRP